MIWRPRADRNKIIWLIAITGLTVAIHYGLVFQPLFGHVHWIHALHGRFCYIPIVIAAAWFGLRGGIYSATLISTLVLPYVFSDAPQDRVGEIVEIIFYYFIGALIGLLVDREFFARRKQQEAQLQVERSQKLSLVGQIAAGVAHEIKNPLASIKGAADIIVDRTASEAAREEFSGILQSEVRRIDSSVSEFLEFARPKETKLERIDFSTLIKASVRQVTPQIEKANLTIETNISEEIIVIGDSEKLHQMILNLILNAITASEKNKTIKISMTVGENRMAELIITDKGSGMPEENLARAFEPFYTTRSGGTGLGLAIVKSIIDAHDGEIMLTSKIDQGTQATVSIPLFTKGPA